MKHADPSSSFAPDQAAGQASSLLAALPAYGTAALLFGLDQFTKWQIAATMPFRSSRPLLGEWLYLTHVHNEGAAFSFLDGQKLVLSVIALAVIAAIVVYERRLKQKSPLQLAALGCILAGSLGNLTDRLRLGHVIDFLDLHAKGRNIWPIFNVADMCINLGVVLLVLYFWRHPEPPALAAGGPAPKSRFKEERGAGPHVDASIKET